ncbi:17602_t:CDS:2, partial [Acaulospora colombiana]
SVNPSTPASKLTPRSFLLSQVPLVAPHALLLVHWDHEGGGIGGNAELRPELRPETQLSLGSEDPRYREFSTISSSFHADGARSPRKPLPDWIQEHLAQEGGGRHRQDTPTDEGPMSPSSPTNDGHVIDHLDAQISTGIVGVGGSGIGGASFDYGFTAEAFANVTPDSSWDYRANRTAVIYDSGDDSETDMDRGAGGNSGTGHQAPVRLGLQTEMLRMGTGPSGVIISEGVALSPSDVDSDIDVTVATGASRFVMQERIRRVYGPLEGDSVESDALDNSSLEQSEDGNDSDATEDGRNTRPDGPTRVGKLKKERMRLREEQEVERLRREEEGQERALASLDAEREGDMDDRKSIRSVRSDMRLTLPKRLPPVPIGVIEAWQAGLLYALTRYEIPLDKKFRSNLTWVHRHVLPGAPYCPNVPTPKVTDTKGNNNNAKIGKKPDVQDS